MQALWLVLSFAGGCMNWDRQTFMALGEPYELHGTVALPLDVYGDLGIQVQRIDAAGEPFGEVFGESAQDKLGRFSVSVAADGVVRVVASGNCYIRAPSPCADSCETTFDDGCWREAVAEVSVYTADISINAVSHLTAPRILRLMAAGESFVEARFRAESELYSQLKLAVDPLLLPPATSTRFLWEYEPSGYLLGLTTVLRQAAGILGMRDHVYLNALQGQLADGGPIDPELQAAFYQAQIELDNQESVDALDELVAATTRPIKARIPDKVITEKAEQRCVSPFYCGPRDIRIVLDEDADGIASARDNCPYSANADQAPVRDTCYERRKAVSLTGAEPEGDGLFADVDGDDIVDGVYIVSESSSRSFAFVISSGRPDGSFDAPRKAWSHEAQSEAPQLRGLADMNGDGYLDVVALLGQAISVWLTHPDGPWDQRVTTLRDLSTAALAIADFDGDGSHDVVLLTWPAEPTLDAPSGLYWLRGDGQGSFAQPRHLDLGNGCTRRIASGDWDADGSADLALVDYYATQLQLLFGDGRGGFVDAVTTTMPSDLLQAERRGEPATSCPGEPREIGALLAGHFTDAKADDVMVAGVVFITDGRAAPRARPLHHYDAGYHFAADFDGNGRADLGRASGPDLHLTYLGR
jgi:hypothetical protein